MTQVLSSTYAQVHSIFVKRRTMTGLQFERSLRRCRSASQENKPSIEKNALPFVPPCMFDRIPSKKASNMKSSKRMGPIRLCAFILLSLLSSNWSRVDSFVFPAQPFRRTSDVLHRRTSTSPRPSTMRSVILHRLAARRRNNNDGGDAEVSNISDGIPQLPAFESHKTGPAEPEEFQKPFVASRKFQLQYTCNVCETRNKHSVSRIAYLKGVVITRCKGCNTQHLIADNLGFTGGFPNKNETTIEEHFADGGVNRVSKEVFDLEHVLQGYDAKSGSVIMGEDGELALE